METKYIIFSLCLALILAGCSFTPQNEPDPAWEETGVITVGNVLTVQKSDERWKLLSNIDTLTAEGLYYAAWSIGENRFEGDDGEDAVNLYDAQLYLLLGEFPDESTARQNMDKWLDVAKANYEILSEEENSLGTFHAYTSLRASSLPHAKYHRLEHVDGLHERIRGRPAVLKQSVDIFPRLRIFCIRARIR